MHLLLSGTHQLDELDPIWASTLISTVPIEVGPLDDSAARELITQPFDDFPPGVWDADAVDRVIELTGRQPFLIQLLCQNAVERVNVRRAGRIARSDVEEAIGDSLEMGQNYLSDLWRLEAGLGQTGDEARLVLSRLAAASEPLKAGTIDRHVLRRLVRRGILRRHDDAVDFAAPLVASYVRSLDV